MEDEEIQKLTTYLRGVFGADDLVVLQHPENEDQALVARGQSYFARIDRDEDEGEISFDLSKDVPDAPPDELKEYFDEIFSGQKIAIRKRKNDESKEIYRDEEFLGVLYPDEGADGDSMVFNMAILDIDLDPEAAGE